ncbi:MAG TPA: acyl-CoA dehydrogenase family protein [Acidimicrobiia bacterium]|nr:acyl-CoA dehydrogenase family protein [Acidimicrobiia bacterium]
MTTTDAALTATSADEATVDDLVLGLINDFDPRTTDPFEFRGVQFDRGLAWVGFPEGDGGLGMNPKLQRVVDTKLREAGARGPSSGRFFGMFLAAPTIVTHGSPELRKKLLRPLFTGEEVWCQLFSEPGAGSDLASLSTRAVRDGDEWVVNGQKVWNTLAHLGDRGMLVTRTDPDVPKHRGLTYFALDMHAPGVDVRPLRQITGEAEFNEVFLTDVRIPDTDRLGEVGEGWKVAQTTLMNERVSIGGGIQPREFGMIGILADTWRKRPEVRTPAGQDAVLQLWVQSEAARLTGIRLVQALAAGQPGPEGSASKLVFARLMQQISGLELELNGEEGLRHDDWTMRRSTAVDFFGRSPGYRYLRAKGNSIEGGSSEILRNIIAERVLGLPSEPRIDKDVAWKDLPR